MTITSNTLVCNGMPFIGKVLKQVAPYMDEMVICLSEKSNDGTEQEIKTALKDYWHKVVWMTENVQSKGKLTDVENQMNEKSTSEWVLFLSDDDYWTPDQLELCLAELDKNKDILSYSVSPYQLLDFEHYDSTWGQKFFAKFLRLEGLFYRFPWPQDMPCDATGTPLYWRTHPKIKVL